MWSRKPRCLLCSKRTWLRSSLLCAKHWRELHLDLVKTGKWLA